MNSAAPRVPSVIVPVFNAAADVAACLAAVAATAPAGSEVLVIDDASPDPGVRGLLGRWAARALPGWRFLRNLDNRGFVGTANRGLRATVGDVVLLNSDTLVTPGWLEGLQRCLDSDPAIATATPWTNNGEIASMPAFCQSNPVPPDLDATAAAVRAAGPPVYPELPTAVGFCMAISRRALDRVGPFDEKLFGRGYGEENDFSMRAAAAGLRNVLCDDVYVAHRGGRSFGPLGLEPDGSSMQRLLSRHPDYLARVEAFIRDDPLAVRRAAVVTALERAAVALR
ncbi:MAG: glycosyltransferase family 2 protein [Xanthomonadales bacterium]